MSSGFLPTGICAIIFSVAVLIRKTTLPLKLVTARRLPSGDMASLCGVSPVSISPMMPLVLALRTVTSADMWSEV